MQFANGNKIEYTYNAAGVRLRKKVTTVANVVTNKYYVNGFEYNDGGLESIATIEGRLTPVVGGDLQYEYHLKDHTGNTVAAIADLNGNGDFDKSNEILQLTHYYPFGMVMNGLSTPAIGTQNKYKFGSKELQDEFGLNELDFGARFYDPAIARWAQLDPMAEGAVDWTPYRYAFDNPMGYSDPSGMFEMPKGQFPDGFDNGSGLHLPGQGGGGWSSSFGGIGSINGNNNYYCTNNAQEAVYEDKTSGYVYNEITRTYQKDGQDVPFSEVLATIIEKGNVTATKGVMSYVWRLNGTGEIAPAGSNVKNSYASFEVLDSGIPVVQGGGGNRVLKGSVDDNLAYLGGVLQIAGYAADANGGTVFKYAQGAKSAAELTAELALTMSKLSRTLGISGIVITMTSDIIGVKTYYRKGSNDTGAVHPAVLGTNLGIGVYGMIAGPPGWIVSSVYFLGNAIPGGWPAAIQAGYQNTQNNQQIIPGWQPRPTGGL